MGYFPFYMEISDKNCIVVGGGRIAFRKVEILLQFDVKIQVIAPWICEELYDLKNRYETELKFIKREFIEEDIDNADIVIAATNNEELNSHISHRCKKDNILVNVVDVKDECNFVFPAMIKENDLVIAISTGGNSPGMASKIKNSIKQAIPDYYGDLIELLGKSREYIRNEIKQPEERKNIYNELIKIGEKMQGNLTTQVIEEVVNKYK